MQWMADFADMLMYMYVSNVSNQTLLFKRDVKGRQGGFNFLDPSSIACSIDIWSEDMTFLQEETVFKT